ncbi:MAG: hypothetical protein JST36_04860 [Bacteroidetes bacterium]|nr:hypothetical protein [Bacteroidota bacterium]
MHQVVVTSVVALLLFGWSSCKKDTADPPAPPASGRQVFVACEGAYGSGNSALTVYYPESGLAIEDRYRQVNNAALGDVFQSITRSWDGRYFLCINNSDKIIVLDKDSLRRIGELSVPKPRYIVQVSPQKAYVSSLFGSKLYVINPQDLSLRGSIPMPFKNPEGMQLVGDKLFVCQWDSANSSIIALDTARDEQVYKFVLAGHAPQSVVKDQDGMLWVLSGNVAEGVSATLTQLHPVTGTSLRSFSFGSADPIRLELNPTKDTLYFLEVAYGGGSEHNGLYRMSIKDTALPEAAFIPAQGFQYFWGLGIDPSTGHIYLSDPKGFTQRGNVSIYQPNGTLVHSFATGVGPGHFLF